MNSDNPLPGWPQNTFVRESEGTVYDTASHWYPFLDNPTDILKKLPEIAKRYIPLRGYGSFYTASHEMPPDWAQGAHFGWPDNHHGLVVTVKDEVPFRKITAVYPYCESGIEVSMTLKQVTVRENGVEAWITAMWDGTPITFFDTRFLNNRCWYETDKLFNFILVGIAYDAGISESPQFPFNPDSQVVNWLENYSRENNLPQPVFTGTLSLEGMGLFLPITDGGRDDYQFRGTVTSVKEAPQILGQPGWLVRATVMRYGNLDEDLEILIIKRIWKGGHPPAKGQDIEGTLWLQGYLWSSHEWEMRGSK